MSRKVSVRLPQPLWEWLISAPGNTSVSSRVVDCLTQVRSVQTPQRAGWFWAVIAVAVGFGIAYALVRLRKQRRKPFTSFGYRDYGQQSY